MEHQGMEAGVAADKIIIDRPIAKWSG